MSGSLTLERVSVSLNGSSILDRVDLGVKAGEWVGLIGPNGAGKSTLLRAVAGIVPCSGSISLDGRPLESLDRRTRARSIALVPQRPFIPAELTVADYVYLGRVPHLGFLEAEGPEDAEAVADALSWLELSELAGRRLGTLSGGELQRVILARALTQQAPLLLLDEPTAALDLGHQQQAMGLIEDLRRRWELTVVIALHDLTLAAGYCDRLMLLSGGRVVAEGSAEEVLDEDTIRRHYGAEVQVLTGPEFGLAVVPLRRDTAVKAAVP